MRDIFVLSMVFGLLPVVFFRPFVGIILWYWIAYMNPHRLTWGIAYDFPVAMVVGITTIVAWLLSNEPKKLRLDGISLLVVIIACWVSITTLFAINQDAALWKWDRTIKILVTTLLTMILANSRERLHALVWIMVISIGFYAAKGGLFTILQGGQYRVFGPQDTFMRDNNLLSLAIIMMLPFAGYLYLNSKEKLLRYSILFVMILSALSVVGSFSRGAIIAGSVMCLFLLMKSPRRLGILLVLLVTIGFVYFVSPEHWFSRMETIAEFQEDASVVGRLDAWRYAINLALERPILGGGFLAWRDSDLFRELVPGTTAARAFHSAFFEMLGEHGFPGVILFVSLCLTAYFSCSKALKLVKNMPYMKWSADLAKMSQTSMIGYAVVCFLNDFAFFDLFYCIIAICYANRLLARDALRSFEDVQPQFGPLRQAVS